MHTMANVNPSMLSPEWDHIVYSSLHCVLGASNLRMRLLFVTGI